MCNHKSSVENVREILASDQFMKYTSKAGDISRQLGLAGVAIIWLLHGQFQSKALEAPLLWGFILIVISLFVDLIQYMVGAWLWGNATFKQNKAATEYSKSIWFCVGCIVLKLIFMCMGYGFILWKLYCDGFL